VTHPAPGERQVRYLIAPSSVDGEHPAWHFNLCDRDHEEWGWAKLTAQDFHELLTVHLAAYERMTWGDIKRAAGGRTAGTNSHSLEVDGFCRPAQNRLVELNLDDCDELFSLRITSRLRLYGLQDGRVLRLLWHDPYHGDHEREAYPTRGR